MLSNVMPFLWQKYSLQQISKSLESSKGGVSMYDISELAKKIGLKCNGKIVSLDILKTYKNPCILHWDQNHFVILCKYKKKRGCCCRTKERNARIRYR